MIKKFFISDQLRNIVFYIVLSVAVVCLILGKTAAVEQDKIIYNKQSNYYNSIYLLQQKKINNAELLMKKAIKDFPDNYVVNWHYGVILFEQKKYKESEIYMRKAKEIRPALLSDQNYLITYGQLLYELKDFKKAEAYLLESKNYISDPELDKKADYILKKLI